MTELSENVTAPAVEAGRRRANLLGLIGKFSALIFLVALVVAFSILRPGFLAPLNIWNIVRQSSITGLIAIGMTFVILTGGIDLSVGSVLALAGMTAAYAYKGGTLLAGATATSGIGVGGAILVACGVGLLCGLIQGLAITRLGVPPFIVTLGGLSAFRGMTLIIGGGGPISAFDPSFNFWGQGKLFMDSENPWIQVPIPVIIYLSVALVAFVVLRYTQYGRYIYAVGGNAEAARLSGLNTRQLILSVYLIVGFLAGLGGFIQASRVNSAEAVAGQGYELTVIASVVIGGTSLFGGEGSVLGTVIGSLLITILSTGLTQMNVSSYYQQIVIGAIIVLAVFFDRITKSRRRA
jgi:ribose/xylose/arabinose/galactoside ABC-type transport system permease subunit